MFVLRNGYTTHKGGVTLDTFMFIATLISLIAALVSLGKDVYALIKKIRENYEEKK